MNVSAIIVTRGNVDLRPVLDSLPPDWQTIVWDNARGWYVAPNPPRIVEGGIVRDSILIERATDLAVYGRYAAIEHASGDRIYVQDDDVIVSDPQAIVDAKAGLVITTEDSAGLPPGTYDERPAVVCNMPPEFRHDFYTDHALVGFGACFHRGAPRRAFERFFASYPAMGGAGLQTPAYLRGTQFSRTCDVVFTTLTPRVLVDVQITHREMATGPDRMYRQPDHVGERSRMLDLARQVRDA